MKTATTDAIADRRTSRSYDGEDTSEAKAETQENEQFEMRKNIRLEVYHILMAGVQSETTPITVHDLKDYMKALKEQELESGGAKTHEKKLEYLATLKHYAYDFVGKAEALGLNFLARVQSAKGGKLSSASAERWKKKLKNDFRGPSWPDVQAKIEAFVATVLPELKQNWERVRSDVEKVHTLAQRAGIEPNSESAIVALKSQEFEDAKYPKQRAMVDRALAVIESADGESSALYDDARAFLEDAAAAELLHPSKVASALKTIFAKGNALADIRTYVQVTLPGYREGWERECAEFEELNGQLAERGHMAAGRMSRKKFLSLGFSAREAHLSVLRDRITLAESGDRELDRLHTTILKEMDAEDYAAAAALLEVALRKFPDDRTLTALAHSLSLQSSEREQDERAPQDVLTSLRRRVRSLPEGVQDLYVAALEADTSIPDGEAGHMGTIKILMRNARELPSDRAESEEQTGREKDELQRHAEVTADNVVVRDTADPSPRILRMGSDPDAQRAVFEGIRRVKGDPRILEDSVLLPEIAEQERARLVGDVNDQLHADARLLQAKGVRFSLRETSPLATPATSTANLPRRPGGW